MSSRLSKLFKQQSNGSRMSEEEAKLMARIKQEDIAWDAAFDADCVFCWVDISASEDFGVVNTSSGTYFLCQECTNRG